MPEKTISDRGACRPEGFVFIATGQKERDVRRATAEMLKRCHETAKTGAGSLFFDQPMLSALPKYSSGEAVPIADLCEGLKDAGLFDGEDHLEGPESSFYTLRDNGVEVGWTVGTLFNGYGDD